MWTGNVVGELDVAILCTAAFFVFFLGLIYYLRQEDKREGYPLEIARTSGGIRRSEGFPPMPKPKAFYRPHDRGVVQVPRAEKPEVGRQQGPGPAQGFPLDPGADPFEEGLGAAAFQARRDDWPDLNVEGTPKVVPLIKWDKYHIARGDADPRGWPIVSKDGEAVGRIVDLWFNRAEFFLRYFEFTVEGEPPQPPRPGLFLRGDPVAAAGARLHAQWG